MSRKLFLKSIQKSYWAIFCVILLSAWIMSGCATLQGKEARAGKNDRPSQSAPTDVKQLAGRWHRQGGGFAEYASYAENLGNFETYEISENGRIKSSTLNAARNYDCIVEAAASREGTISSAPGSTELNISFETGTIKKTNNCSPEKNSTESTGASNTSYKWKVGEDKTGATLLYLTKANGETAIYRREE
jgi:hypothetical protein